MSTENMTDPKAQTPAGFLERFGLHEEPFAVEPDPAFFCADSTLTQRLDMLHNLTEFGMLLLLVIGDSGMGKTTVLEQFLQTANSNWQICDLNAVDLANAHDLIEDLANGFDVPGGDLTLLGEQLDKLRAQGRLAVLLVDDAERLPDAALRTLLELSGAAGESNKRLRLVLFGTQELQNKIAALSPEHAENSHVFTIPPLTELQTAAYLRHRLAIAGQTGDSPFTTAQVRSIYRASNGVPALINARARQKLIDMDSVSGSAVSNVRTATSNIAAKGERWKLFAAVGVAMLMLAIAFWPEDPKDIYSETAALTTAKPAPEKTVDLALPQVPGGSTPAASATDSTATTEAQMPTATPLPAPTLGPEVEHPPVTSTTGKIEVSAVPAPEIAPVVTTAKPSPTPPLTTVTLPVEPTEPARVPQLKPPVVPTAAPPGTPVVNQAAHPTEKPVAQARVDLADKLPTTSVTTPSTPGVDTKNAAPNAKKVATASQVKSQRSGDYTLQVLAARSEAAVRQYAKANRINDQATILRTTRQGQDWYVLLYGNYPSRAAAGAALAKLPAAVRANHPWPRSFASVHADAAKKP